MKLAAVYISEKRFENCFLTLDRIAFDKLTPSDQNKYFELLLYGRLMSGDISQANEIFVSAEHYFKRGLLDKRNGQMLFTLGLLEYFNERNGMFLCVGCGRCIKKCPMNIDITKFIKQVMTEEV